MKWVILIVQIMFILSCSAQKTSNEREALSLELSQIIKSYQSIVI